MAEQLDFSIVIPTKDREHILVQTLQKALDAIENNNVEIIVVNDGSELKQTIRHKKIQYFKNPKQGVTTARNFGASIAKSNYLLFLDDDMWITKKTIHAIEDIKKNIDLEETTICLNWEYPEVLNNKLEQSKIGRLILDSTYNSMKGRTDKNIVWNNIFEPMDGIGSCSFFIEKNVFKSIGQYNETIIFQGEDIDISNRLIQNNIKILAYTPITCLHNHQDRLDIKGYIDRTFRGYSSQAMAEKSGIISAQFIDKNSLKNRIYRLLLPLESLLIFIFNILPNSKIFDFITFKIIGILGSFQKIKAYKLIVP